MVYDKSRLVRANFFNSVVAINTACQRDESGYKSAKKKKWTAKMYKRNLKLVAEVVE